MNRPPTGDTTMVPFRMGAGKAFHASSPELAAAPCRDGRHHALAVFRPAGEYGVASTVAVHVRQNDRTRPRHLPLEGRPTPVPGRRGDGNDIVVSTLESNHRPVLSPNFDRYRS